MDSTKACTKCKQIKLLSEFTKKATNKADGMDYNCKKCRSAYRKENKDHISTYNKSWHQVNMNQERKRCIQYHTLNKSKIAARKAARYALDSTNDKARNREWKQSNPEQARSYLREYRAKKKEADGTHTVAEVQTILLHQKSLCVACRSGIERGYHIDHINPLSKGGSNDKYNIQLLCVKCNTSKHAKHPIDFMQSKGYLL